MSLLVLLSLPIPLLADPLEQNNRPGIFKLAVTAAESRARLLLENGHAPEAVSLLKKAIEQHPHAEVLRWLLVRAYLLDGNDFWAIRTLAVIAEFYPENCEPALWTAEIYLQQGSLDNARENLAAANCPSATPSETRKTLLLSMVEYHSEQREKAKYYLDLTRRALRIYPEDRVALDYLTSVLDPGYLFPFTGKLELSLGWASNARAGSPVDPATKGLAESSPAGQLNLWMRFVSPTGRWMRPSLEVETRLIGYTAQSGKDLSYLMIGSKPGILIGNSVPNVLLSYHFDALLLAGGDRYESGPLWFYNAHRAEIEASILSNISLFGGAGRRLFREIGRSRVEVDGGVGGSILLHEKLRLLGALTGRWHNADKAAYDLGGGSALLSAEVRLRKDWSLRVGALTGLDWYPRSAGYFDVMAPDTNRRDILLKLSASGFSPIFSGFKVGATYEYANRFSTAEPYDYQDHRFWLKLTFSFSADPWAPKAFAPPKHVPLDHGIASFGFEDRLQDLLRQDEAAQRSSSCVE